MAVKFIPNFKEKDVYQKTACDALEVSDRNLQLPNSPSICSGKSLAALQPFIEAFCEDAWEKTLFVFDIDQTLLKPRADEAQSKAIAQHWAAFKASTPPLSTKQHDMLFSAAVATQEISLMEPTAPGFLENLKRKGARVMALTASQVGRVLDCERFEIFRHEQCQAFGFHFSRILDEDERELPLPKMQGRPPYYYKGAVFCNGLHVEYTKGDVLRTFLNVMKEQGHSPERVVFVDDARRNILSVHESLSNFKHLCCEYTCYQDNKTSVSEEAFLRYWKGLLRKVQNSSFFL